MIRYTNILKSAFSEPLPGIEAQHLMSPSVRFTGHHEPDTTVPRNSSVFILLFMKNGSWHVPFIQRPVYDGAHSGQVSFPGGKSEESDQSLIDTAFRETEEEIGIKRQDVHFVGTLTSLYIPNSNFMVYPQVGIIHSEPKFELNSREVETLIEAPLSQLLHPSSVKRFSRQINNYQVEAPFFCIEGYEIWGATAMILSEFLQVIKKHSIDLRPLSKLDEIKN